MLVLSEASGGSCSRSSRQPGGASCGGGCGGSCDKSRSVTFPRCGYFSRLNRALVVLEHLCPSEDEELEKKIIPEDSRSVPILTEDPDSSLSNALDDVETSFTSESETYSFN